MIWLIMSIFATMCLLIDKRNVMYSNLEWDESIISISSYF